MLSTPKGSSVTATGGIGTKTKLVVGNWSLSARAPNELVIHNSDGQQQATVLREELAGFIFESNRGTKHTFTAETMLGLLLNSTLLLNFTGSRMKKVLTFRKINCVIRF